jgi:hypothetical protein
MFPPVRFFFVHPAGRISWHSIFLILLELPNIIFKNPSFIYIHSLFRSTVIPIGLTWFHNKKVLYGEADYNVLSCCVYHEQYFEKSEEKNENAADRVNIFFAHPAQRKDNNIFFSALPYLFFMLLYADL